VNRQISLHPIYIHNPALFGWVKCFDLKDVCSEIPVQKQKTAQTITKWHLPVLGGAVQ
jgi:hypothetical protein